HRLRHLVRRDHGAARDAQLLCRGHLRREHRQWVRGRMPGVPDQSPDPQDQVKTIYFDCPSGASGDMILGALLDAGVSLDALRAELRKLQLAGWELTASEVRRGAFRATKADVAIDARAHHRERSLGEVLKLLGDSALDPAVKAGATRIFTRLAEAEARVHGTTVEAVHFHDVGAVDAIIDVTGAVAGLHLVGVESVHVSALPIGGGMVDGPHGKIPVPAPGTAELLKGFPVVDTGVKAELVTPTG